MHKQPHVIKGSLRERATPAVLGKACLGSDQRPEEKGRKEAKQSLPESGLNAFTIISLVYNNFIINEMQ